MKNEAKRGLLIIELFAFAVILGILSAAIGNIVIGVRSGVLTKISHQGINK